MFLRAKRSGEVISKQGLMPNNTTLPYPIPPLFASQKLFVGFSPKGLSEFEASMSPTSILETMAFSSTDKRQRKHPIGLGLVDFLHSENKTHEKSFNQENRMVLFGSKLKIQIPIMQPNSIESPQSPIEFGIKTKNSQLGLHSPLSFDASPSSSFSPQLLQEMELSEDYTCVISHGPNPKTTHIFDNCIVGSCDGDGIAALRKENGLPGDQSGSSYSSDDFLSFCHGCKNSLSQGRDIFMYRGEKAFCSEDCRHREMLIDEGMEKFPQDLSELL